MSIGNMHHLPFRNSVHLSEPEAYALMGRILSGEMSTESITEFLMYVRRKGETVSELVGFANALRDAGAHFELDQSQEPVIDTCGTGGDGASTFNISTATAFVLAGAGLRVAKHGNRRISSRCGSADVLEALGIPVDLTAEKVAACIEQTGIGFLYAPVMHPAVKHSQEARLMLKGRTVFNLLGPLTNPLRARVQLIGAFSVRAAEMLAQAAARLGIARAYVVYGASLDGLTGLDEITTTGQTTVFEVEDGRVQKHQWMPEDFGLPTATIDELSGGDPQMNADLIRAIMEGEEGPRRDVVVANAAAAILLAGRATDLPGAARRAAESIDSGAARQKMEALGQFARSLTNEVI